MICGYKLQVQWDEPSSILRPDRVSPWELEPLVATTPSNSQPVARNKRPRPPTLPAQMPDLSALGMKLRTSDISEFICVVFIPKNFCPVIGMWKPPAEQPPTFGGYSDSPRGPDLFLSPKFSSNTKDSSISYTDNGPMSLASSKSMHWSKQAEAGKGSFASLLSKDTGETRQGNGYRLFGIELLDHNTEKSSPMVVSGAAVEDQSIPSLDAESDQQSVPSDVDLLDHPTICCDPEKSCLRTPQESHIKQTRSCTKVLLLF